MDEIIIPILRSISWFFDNIVYGLISMCYELLIYLSNVDIVTGNEYIGSLINRIYVLLGIFMLFKVSFSIIQYIVDPNAFTDSGKGFGKLVTNLLVAIVLLVSVPWIFDTAYKFQGAILRSNVIGSLIMGTSFENGGEVADPTQETIKGTNATTMARDAQFLTFSAFFKVNPDAISACEGTPILGSKSMASENGRQCLEELNTFMSENDDIGKQGVTLNDFFPTTAGDARKFESFGALASAKKDGQFVIDYLPIISTLAGGYVVFLLITFCIDVAIRVLKLAFLQMVAPISIVSYIDPKESMSNSKLHNWIKEVVSTYASLFIRLATIFLVMVLISAIASTVLESGNLIDKSQLQPNAVYNMFIYVFLIIGAFMFAKQVPQMIENLFGIKMSGQLNLNPMKAYKESGLGAAVGLGGAAIGGAVLGGIGNTAANMARNRELKQKLSPEEYKNQKIGIGNMLGSAVGGAGAGMFRSGAKGFKSQNPISAVAEGVTAGSQRRRARQAGYGFVQNAKDSWTDIAGIPGATGTTSEIKGKIKELSQRKENAQRDEATASDLMRHIIAQDANKSASFMEAFREDNNGNLQYSGYNEFFRAQMAQYGQQGQQAINDLDNRIAKIQDPMQQRREIDSLASQFDGLITNTDYNNLESARAAREAADKRGKDLEKEIKTLQETTEYRKGQKPKK